MLAECAARTRTTPISSHAALSAPTITWSVTASISRAPSAALHQERAVRCGAAGPSRRNHQRRLRELHDRRPVELLRRGAGDDDRVDRLAVEERPPPAALLALRRLARPELGRRMRP